MIGGRTLVGRRRERRPSLVTPAFLAVSLSTLAYFTADGILLPAVPLYVEGPLGGGDASVGLAVGSFSISALLLRARAGRLGDRRGRALIMVVGAAMFALSVLGYGLTSSVPMLVVLRLLTGAGEAFFFVGAASAVADLAPPERRGEAMSLFSLSLYIGIGIGPLAGEVLATEVGFWAAWLAAAAGAGVAMVLALRAPGAPRGVAPTPTGRYRLVHPAGVRPALLLLAALWGMGGFLAFVPLHALDVGLGGSRFVLLLFAGIVVGIRSVWADLPDRLGPRRATRVALGTAALGLAIIGGWPAPVGLFLGTAVFAVGVALATPAIMSLAMEAAPPEERGEVMGTVTASLDIAFGLGPTSFGLAAETMGRGGTFLLGSLAAAIGLAYALRTRLPGRAEARS